MCVLISAITIDINSVSILSHKDIANIVDAQVILKPSQQSALLPCILQPRAQLEQETHWHWQVTTKDKYLPFPPVLLPPDIKSPRHPPMPPRQTLRQVDHLLCLFFD